MRVLGNDATYLDSYSSIRYPHKEIIVKIETGF